MTSAIEAQLKAYSKLASSLEEKLASREEEIHRLKKSLRKRDDRNNVLQKECDNRKSIITRLKKQCDKQSSKLAHLSELLEGRQPNEVEDRDDLLHQLEKYKSHNIKLVQERQTLSSENADLWRKLEHVERDRKRLRKECESLREENASKDKAIAALESSSSASKKQLPNHRRDSVQANQSSKNRRGYKSSPVHYSGSSDDSCYSSNHDPDDVPIEKYQSLKAEYEVALERVLELSKELCDTKTTLDTLQHSSSNDQEVIERYNGLREEHEQALREITLLKRELEHAVSKNKSDKQEQKEMKEDYESRLVEITEECDSLTKKLESVKKDYYSKFEDLEKDVLASEEVFNKQCAALKNENKERCETITRDYNQKKEELTSQIEAQAKRFEELNYEFETFLEIHTEVEDELSEMKEKYDDSLKKIVTLEDQVKAVYGEGNERDETDSKNELVKMKEKYFDALNNVSELNGKYEESLKKIVFLESKVKADDEVLSCGGIEADEQSFTSQSETDARLKDSLVKSRDAMKAIVHQYKSMRKEYDLAFNSNKEFSSTAESEDLERLKIKNKTLQAYCTELENKIQATEAPLPADDKKLKGVHSGAQPDDCSHRFARSLEEAEAEILRLREEVRIVKLEANAARIRHEAREKELKVVSFQFKNLMREYKAATLRSSTASSHSSQVVSETNDTEDGYDANIISNEPKATDGKSDEACIDSNSSEELTSSLTSSHENDANEAEVKQLRKDLRAAELKVEETRVELSKTKERVEVVDKKLKVREQELREEIQKYKLLECKAEAMKKLLTDKQTTIHDEEEDAHDILCKEGKDSITQTSTSVSEKIDNGAITSYDGSYLTSACGSQCTSSSAEGRDDKAEFNNAQCQEHEIAIEEIAVVKLELAEAQREVKNAKTKQAAQQEHLHDVLYKLKVLRSEHDALKRRYDALVAGAQTDGVSNENLLGSQEECDALRAKIASIEAELEDAKSRAENAEKKQKIQEGHLWQVIDHYKKLEAEHKRVVEKLETTEIALSFKKHPIPIKKNGSFEEQRESFSEFDAQKVRESRRQMLATKVQTLLNPDLGDDAKSSPSATSDSVKKEGDTPVAITTNLEEDSVSLISLSSLVSDPQRKKRGFFGFGKKKNKQNEVL